MRKNKKILLFPLFLSSVFTIVFSLSFSTNCFAKKKKKKGKSKREVISFEDELISGESNKPELFYLFEKKKYNFKKLIKLRNNFLPEMRSASGNIQRSGSKD